ncbi:MAG: epimerase [Alphaproteobacteria bacterium]|nr:epimerase [Alphaproteobacteria bacterium]
MTKTALILGASGKFGRACSIAFKADGWSVRHYDRNTDMTKAAIGADIIVNGLNPPAYHNWAKLIPAITADVIQAAKASGATVILPGNVYPLGDTPGIWDENTPHNPNSRKGHIRKEMEETYRRAAQSGVQTINLRAGDIIDPDSSETIFDMVMFKGLTKGKLTLLGRADIPHAYCYVPDFARAAVALANKRDQLELYEDIPFAGQTLSGDEINETLENLLNRRLKVNQFPWLMMRLLSPFWELARELTEMRYLWNTAHQLSNKKLKRLLPGFEMTPNRVVLANALAHDIDPDKAMVRPNAAI